MRFCVNKNCCTFFFEKVANKPASNILISCDCLPTLSQKNRLANGDTKIKHIKLIQKTCAKRFQKFTQHVKNLDNF